MKSTIQEAFKLADEVQSQLQVADSFKLELSNNFSSIQVNEMSAEEIWGDEFEVNEMSRGRRWGNNDKHSSYNNNNNNSNKPCFNKPQDRRSGKTWENKNRDSKITLTQDSSHFIPSQFSNNFFKQFDLAMKMK